MIAFLPEILEDELFSSWIMRMFKKSAFIYPKHFAKEVMKSNKEKFNYLYVNKLNDEFLKLIFREYNFESLIEKHTLHGYDNLFGSYSGTSSSSRHIRYCPLCSKEAKEKHIQLLPQIKELNYCPIHGAKYCDSNISLNRNANYLIRSIDDFQNNNYKVYKMLDLEDINVKISKYTLGILKVSKIGCNPVKIHIFLRSQLPSAFFKSKTKAQINVIKIKDSLDAYYENLINYKLSLKDIERVFIGECVNPFKIILIAYWLCISPQQLVNRKVKHVISVETKIEHLRKKGLSERQIAKIVGISKTKVHNQISKIQH